MTDQTADTTVKVVPRLGYGDFLRFSQLLLDRYGLNLPEKRRASLESGVQHAFAASTCATLDEYFERLLQPDSGVVELDRLVNAVTISESHFFRDAGQFDALYNHVLPDIIERRRPMRTLRIWSAGCAGGEEPHSIAMLLRELLPDVDEWAITILGTDINTESLERARMAIYGDWAFREDRAKQWRPNYFKPHGKRHELIHEVGRMVTFAKLNLAEDSFPSYESNTALMDLILCRNVMIYLSPPVIRRIVDRFYRALTDGGWLAVGHSEPSLITYKQFQVRNFPSAIVYQRTDTLTKLPQGWGWQVDEDPDQQLVDDKFVDSPATIIANPIESTKPESEPQKEIDVLERAREMLEYGHSEKARDLLLEKNRADPNDIQTHILLGRAYANLGRWRDAESACRKTLQLNPLSLEAYYILALVLQHQGKLDEAIVAMKKVVFIDRAYVLGHFGLASLYHNQGRLPQAQKSLDNARRLLEECSADELIAGSGGITAGRLRQAIIHQQQAWSADAQS